MSYKNYCVIDSNGFYKASVLAYFTMDAHGNQIENIHKYELRPEESLVSAAIPIGMISPRLIANKWVEAATSAEIEAAKPPAQPVTISESDRISALEEAILSLALGGTIDV